MPPRITWHERERTDQRNRALLAQDLLRKRLLFASRPYEAHVQFSNFCNMSCVMCWDGENPPLQRMSPEMIARVEAELAPDLTVIIPHGGSEPLVLTWDETRQMAETYSVELGLTTNAQFLDEKKFHELEEIVEAIVLSIDSHVPGIFARIRPKGRPDKVFENVATTARLAAERRIDCIFQIVFMTENAALLPETVAYAADTGISMVNVLQLVDFNGRSGYSDPLQHFSAEYVQWTKDLCIETAREKKIGLRWLEHETYDFRDNPIRVKPHRQANEELNHWAKYAFPGYCKYVYSRLRVHADGEIAPCGWATEGDLTLGNIGAQNVEQVWNGVNARDLRRAHLTADYPTLCKTCRFTDPVPARADMPFVTEAQAMICEAEADPVLAVIDPPHLSRLSDAPLITVETPYEPPVGWFMAVSLGGGIDAPTDADELHLTALEPRSSDGDVSVLRVPTDLWGALRTNMGYWWALFALMADGGPLFRSTDVRCLIRHEAIERIPGSTLVYPDQEARPLADLGGAKQRGWLDRDSLQRRPRVRPKPSGLWSGARPVGEKRSRRRVKADVT